MNSIRGGDGAFVEEDCGSWGRENERRRKKE
jgi:hypothetical protein